MIVTEKKSLSEILDTLLEFKKLFLIGCGECATTCKTGGEKECLELKTELEKQGKIVLGFCVPSAPCIASQIKTALAKSFALINQAEAVLVLACGLGVQSVRENLRIKKPVLPGLNSLFIGILDNRGNFRQCCSLCGDCLLAKTKTYCPITLCPKGLLNGPCGGMTKGKCEVNKENDCVWVLIYNAFKEENQLKRLKLVNPPRDYLKINKPQVIKIQDADR